MHINWQQLSKKEFVNEKKLDLSKFFEKEIYITLKKISAIILKQTLSYEGQLVSVERDIKSGKEFILTRYEKGFDEKLNNIWQLYFDYGVCKTKHNFGDFKLSIAFFKEMAEQMPRVFEYIEEQILLFNGREANNKEIEKKLEGKLP